MLNLSQSPLMFWYEHIGRHLSDNPPEKTVGAMVKLNGAKGGKLSRIGSAKVGPMYYLASDSINAVYHGGLPATSYGPVISYGSSREHMRILFRDLTSLPWKQAPFMFGMVGLANPAPSFCISYHPSQATFCAVNGGSVTMDLSMMKEMHDLAFEHDPEAFLKGLRLYDDFMRTGNATAICKHTEKFPALRKIIPGAYAKLRPGTALFSLFSSVLWSSLPDKSAKEEPAVAA